MSNYWTTEYALIMELDANIEQQIN